MVAKLLVNNAAYVNTNYAEWAHDGIDFTTFAASYNQVKEANLATLQLAGNETTGFALYGVNVSHDPNATSGYNVHVSKLSGLQADLYNWGNSTKYWLASLDSSHSSGVLIVQSDDSHNPRDLIRVGLYYTGGDIWGNVGIRPLVCLKSNIQLEKNGDAYDIIATQQGNE